MNQQFRRHRYPTEYPVAVKTGVGLCQSTIIDINLGGARLINVTGIKRGDQIILNILNERIAALVRWHGADRTGISFLMPVRPMIVDTVRQSSSRVGAWAHNSGELREMR